MGGVRPRVWVAVEFSTGPLIVSPEAWADYVARYGLGCAAPVREATPAEIEVERAREVRSAAHG